MARIPTKEERLQFMRQIAGSAYQVAAEGYPINPGIVAAQAALETGYGVHIPASIDGRSSSSIRANSTGISGI